MRLRRSALAAALVLSATAAGSAQAALGDLPVGPGGKATPNVHFLANLPIGTGTGGTFLGNHYFATSADTAWFTVASTQPVTGGLFSFDISNPEQPVYSGSLPIPHHENEDLQVSAKRNLAIVSQQPFRENPQDVTSDCVAGRQYLVDVSIPSAMRLLSVFATPAQVGRVPERSLCGPGHTTTLVDHDNYLWVSGARNASVYVIDIHDPSKPKGLGYIKSPAGEGNPFYHPGVVHDVDVDQFGDVWLTGSGGTAVYQLTKNPLKPTLIAAVTPSDNLRADQLIHHGSQRLDKDTVVITEEDYQAGCDSASHQDGSLQTWRIDRAHKRLVQIGSYDAPKNADDNGTLSSGICSSHWFTINGNKVVADAWYGAGVRFFDLSNPRAPRPIGVWAGDSTIASQARFVPGRPDLVYVADYERGVDVIKIDNGGKGAKTISPRDEKASPTSPVGRVNGLGFAVHLHPDETFGWACAVPSVG